MIHVNPADVPAVVMAGIAFLASGGSITIKGRRRRRKRRR